MLYYQLPHPPFTSNPSSKAYNGISNPIRFGQGVSYTLSTTSLPPLLALPTATPASTTFRHLRALTSQHTTLLSTISTTSLLIAYALSPRNARHPYLLWTVLTLGLGYGDTLWDLVVGTKKDAEDDNGNGSTSDKLSESWDVEAGNMTPEEEEVNGEAVREGMEKWQGKMMLRTGFWGLAWMLCTVGIWGDGA